MPTKKFYKRSEMQEGTRAECMRRWREHNRADWTEAVARFWISDPPTADDLKARSLAAELAATLRSADAFVNARLTALRAVAGGDAVARRAISVELKVAAAAGELLQSLRDPDGRFPDVDELEELANPRKPAEPERSHLVRQAYWWGYNRGETMHPAEIALASLLLGNFPSVPASDLKRGMTAAGVIQREAAAIRAPLQRARKADAARAKKVR